MRKGPLPVLRALRLAALALAALAALDPRLNVHTNARSVAVLLDLSDSMGSGGRILAAEAAASVLEGLATGDTAALVVFAGRPLVVSPAGPPAEALAALRAAKLEAPEPESSDPAAALALGAELVAGLPGERILVLVSDGMRTAGAPPDASALADAGIRVAVLPVGADSVATAALDLNLPDKAQPGQRVSGSAAVPALAPGRYELNVSVDGVQATSTLFDSDGSAESVPFGFTPASGNAELARVDASVRRLDGGSPAEAATASAYLGLGGSGLNLVVSRFGAQPSPVAQVLDVQGLPALPCAPDRLPQSPEAYSGIACVILDDVPASDLDTDRVLALDDFASGGGGVLVIGGRHSLGLGAYYDSPLEAMLPVDTDLRKRLLFTRARLLFIIDASGSMAERVGDSVKQLAAMKAVAAAVAELNPQDEMGILSFDSTPRWLYRFGPLSQDAAASLSDITQGGGTDIEAAVLEALRGFGPPGPTKRHAILITDGISSSYDPAALAGRLKEAQVSLSAIAVGNEVRGDELKTLAEASGGSYYRAELDKLPLVSSGEAASLSRDLAMDARVRLEAAGGSALGSALAAGAHPVNGYLLVRPRPLALVHLVAPTEDGEPDPVLVEWRYGAGRVAVFSADSGAQWLSPWSGRPEYNRLWASLTRALGREAATPGLRAAAFVEGGMARVVAEVTKADGTLARGLRLSAAGPDGRTISLEETAPGRYEAVAPLPAGLSSWDVRADGVDQGSGRATAWAWSPVVAESPAAGRDDDALNALAAARGGLRLDADRPALPPSEGGHARLSLSPLAAALALLALVLELAARSLLSGRLGLAARALRSWAADKRSEADSLESSLSRNDADARRNRLTRT